VVVLVALGLAVAVDQDLLLVRAQGPADVDRLLLAGREAGGVEVVPVLVRDRAFILLEPPDQLLRKGVGESSR
jgi:hypothetical protein